MALAEYWNGQTLTIQPTPIPAHGYGGILSAVSCSAAESCTAVGAYFRGSYNSDPRTFAEQWNGSGWSAQIPPDPSEETNDGDRLLGVSCLSNVSCTATGTSYDYADDKFVPLVEDWDG